MVTGSSVESGATKVCTFRLGPHRQPSGRSPGHVGEAEGARGVGANGELQTQRGNFHRDARERDVARSHHLARQRHADDGLGEVADRARAEPEA